MRQSLTQKYWIDEPLWEHRNNKMKANTDISLQLMEERISKFNEPEIILQDASDNWEYDNQFHKCWHCDETGHEEGMHKNTLGYWVHNECELYMEETIKYLKY